MRFGRSLSSRLVVLGLVQLLLLTVGAVVIFIAEGPHGEAYPEDALRRPTIERLAQVVEQPAALADELDTLRAARVEVSIYDEARQLVATNVEPPLAIPERHHGRGAVDHGPGDRLPDDHAPPDDRGPPPPGFGGPDDRGPPLMQPDGVRQHVMLLGLSMHGARGFLVARGVHGAGPGFIGPGLTLGFGLLVLVVGALISARWILRPIEQLTRTARALGAGDLTARSRLHRGDEIGELGTRLDEMAERVQTLLASEKELLANVAHELRTPLARIGVALDIAGEGDAVVARASLAEIHIDVTELSAIVDDILVAMRFEVGADASLPLHRADSDPADIARAAADRMRTRHGDRPLAVRIAEDLPRIDVDPMLFRRVLDNLLENAHKYTPEHASAIDLAVSRDGGDVVFEVHDRGIGIAPEDLPRVFTAFFRSERSRSRETGGVGLGLTLAKRIVEAHDGAITVTSRTDAGTIVRVAVPCAVDLT